MKYLILLFVFLVGCNNINIDKPLKVVDIEYSMGRDVYTYSLDDGDNWIPVESNTTYTIGTSLYIVTEEEYKKIHPDNHHTRVGFIPIEELEFCPKDTIPCGYNIIGE